MDEVAFFKMTDKQLLKAMRASMQKEGLILTEHAKIRMKQRGILIQHVRECLLKGNIVEPTFIEKQAWKVSLSRICAGMRVKIIVAYDMLNGNIIVTVIKE